MTRHDPSRPDRIVAFIREFTSDHGYGPSVREIADGVDLTSPSAAFHWLRVLEEDGRVIHEPGIARGFRLASSTIDPGVCQRPGCGNPLPDKHELWCSNDCGARAGHVRDWLRRSGQSWLLEELGL